MPRAGDIAGYPDRDGYWWIEIDGVEYPRSHLVWKMHHGRDPVAIEHIDGNPSNDAISNLREIGQ
jgi:hypothetical protein